MQLGHLDYVADQDVQVVVRSYSAGGPSPAPDRVVLGKGEVLRINVVHAQGAVLLSEPFEITLQITPIPSVSAEMPRA